MSEHRNWEGSLRKLVNTDTPSELAPARGSESLEQLIEAAAANLPPDWIVRVEVQREYGEVIVTRPDGTERPMSDGEMTIAQQFREASFLIRDELEAERILKRQESEAKRLGIIDSPKEQPSPPSKG